MPSKLPAYIGQLRRCDNVNLRASFGRMALIFIRIEILPSGLVYAQVDIAFDSIQVGLQYSAKVNRNVRHRFHGPITGIEGFIQTPFCYGDLILAIQVLPCSGREHGPAEDSEGMFSHLKWGSRLAVAFEMEWFTGVGVGVHA